MRVVNDKYKYKFAKLRRSVRVAMNRHCSEAVGHVWRWCFCRPRGNATDGLAHETHLSSTDFLARFLKQCIGPEDTTVDWIADQQPAVCAAVHWKDLRPLRPS